MLKWISGELNIFNQCKANRISIWQCPPFLFVIMGFINISAVLSSYIAANKFFVDDPMIAALIALLISLITFIIGYAVVKSFDEMAEISQMKSEFVSIASHQLRTPLSAIRWTIDLILSGKLGPQTEEQKNILINLQESNERMINLVNNLLDINRIESGRIILKVEPVSIVEITKKTITELSNFALANNIGLEFENNAEIPFIQGDPERLKIVIQNLIDNAIKFSRSGGQAKIKITKDKKNVMMTVTDQGIGISKTEQSRMFQKFFRAKAALRQQTVGSGLGLYISRAIIESLGGKLGFQSEENKGSIFWFKLPIYPPKFLKS
ncbi:MAG: HAMP domain-containing histidine kinase [Parcubacteria group bacterium]|nr:HAMP domain-containing histidine kinase [Parcubacteria group bacterium]